MRIAQYLDEATWRVGLIENDELIEVGLEAGVPATTIELLQAGAEGLDAARRAAIRAPRRPLAIARLGPPVMPRKFLGLGFCYRSHAREMERRGMTVPVHQNWFNKQVTAVNGPYDPIHRPYVSDCLDYEGELAFVIGKRGRHIGARDAMHHVAGFMICNDVSVRDWQRRSPTATLGKSFDTHAPIGPWITTIDEMPDPTSLSIRTWVDGELRQDGNTAEMVWSFAEMIEELSTVCTLEPGDVITTGTPAGVGQSFDPPRFLEEGQRVRVEISGLGHIENLVIPEPLPATATDHG